MSAGAGRQLGDGLVMRWSQSDDLERVAQLIGDVFRPGGESPPSDQFATEVRMLMRGDHPLMGPEDFAIVEDTSKRSRPVVASTCLWRHEWLFDDVPFNVGRPEFVATDPDYRGRGLIRALFEIVHARSVAQGHLLQAITGIPYFYRQLGYEYSLDHFGSCRIYSSRLPPLHRGDTESFSLRPAVESDATFVQELYSRSRRGSIIWNNLTDGYWRYHLVRSITEPASALNNFLILLDQQSARIGVVVLAAARYGAGFRVLLLELKEGESWVGALPFLIHSFQRYGEQLPVPAGSGSLSEIELCLGRSHPAYDVLGNRFAPYRHRPEAWYVRVPDLAALIDRITPVLERRLSSSPAAAGYSGDFHLDFYRDGLRLALEKGRMMRVEPWRAPAYHSTIPVLAGMPPDLMVKLLFGHNSLAELEAMYPDVQATGEARVLIDAMFPARPSAVFPPDVSNI